MGCILLLGLFIGQSYGQTNYRDFLNLGNPGFGGGANAHGEWTRGGLTSQMIGENGQTFQDTIDSSGRKQWNDPGISSRTQTRAGLNMAASKPKLLGDMKQDWTLTCKNLPLPAGASYTDAAYDKCFPDSKPAGQPRDANDMLDEKIVFAEMQQKSDAKVAEFLKSRAANHIYDAHKKDLSEKSAQSEKALYEELMYKFYVLNKHEPALPMKPAELRKLNQLRQKYDKDFDKAGHISKEIATAIQEQAYQATEKEKVQQSQTNLINDVKSGSFDASKYNSNTDIRLQGNTNRVQNSVSRDGRETEADRAAQKKLEAKQAESKEEKQAMFEQLHDEAAKKRQDSLDGIFKAANANSMKKLQGIAAKAVEGVNQMQQKMNQKRDEFGNVIANRASQYEEETQKILSTLQVPIEGVDLQMEPGGGIVDGEFIEEAGWELDMEEAAGDVSDWASAGSPSDDVASSSDDILDLLVQECYRGIASSNRKQVDKNCATADVLTYKCESPIDASFYIGVTFDLTIGYSPTGYRGKLIKHWCREMNTYKGQFDVPDGMHIQGVYDTTIETSVSTNENEFYNNIAKKMTDITGNSAFAMDRTDDSAVGGSAESKGKEASGGSGNQGGKQANGGGAGTDANADGNASFNGSYTTTKTAAKIGVMKSLAGASKNTFQHMYAKMDLNIIRYEMFLREVAPQWLHEDFLDCFMMLPNSYYAPKAKEMFEDFIKRYGTHYVHAAEFGGQLSVIKKKTMIDGMTLTDVRKDAQEEMDAISGQAANEYKLTAHQEGTANVAKLQAEGAGFKIDVTGDFDTEAETDSFDNRTVSQSGNVTLNTSLEAVREINRNRFKRSSTSTKVVAIGGSHMIAQVITDLYSASFRSNLVKWLDSIAYFPKPFNPQLLPISNMMKHLIDDMIDTDCYKSCFIDREPNCKKEREHQIPCDVDFAESNPNCKNQCAEENTSECSIKSPRLINCRDVVEMKDRLKRKVEALRQATTQYLQSGLVSDPEDYTIAAGNANCKQAYGLDTAENEQTSTDGGEKWNDVGQSQIEIVFGMKEASFNLKGYPLDPNAIFYVNYDQIDRRWYTWDETTDGNIPEFASPPVPFKDLKTIETRQLGVFARIPKEYVGGNGRKFGMVRLRMGLFVEIEVDDMDVFFTQRCLDAMKNSGSQKVIDFYTAYRPLLIEMAKQANGVGALIGAANRIIAPTEITGKVEKPCIVFWQNSQQFEAADNVQQCVKVNVETTYEYFVVFAATQADPSSWIYLHQTHKTLCLRKLNKELTADEINVCARTYGKMATGTISNMVEQLYFCMHREGDLLTLSVARPSYNRLDRENAVNILTHSIIQSSVLGQESIMPRFYAIGSGDTAPVRVRSVYMTVFDNLDCRAPFVKKLIGGSMRCELPCDEQCSDLGCKRQYDPTACYSCKNSKLVIIRDGVADVNLCRTDCTGNSTYHLRDNDVITTEIFISQDTTYYDLDRDPLVDTQQICVNCNKECDGRCTGPNDDDCVGTPRCKNAQREDPDSGVTRCLAQCEDGTYPVESNLGSRTIIKCETCNAACKTCDSDSVMQVNGADYTLPSTSSTVPKCTIGTGSATEGCSDGYVGIIINSVYIGCVEDANDDPDLCPDGFEKLRVNNNGESKFVCERQWRAVAYQKFSNGDFSQFTCQADSCTVSSTEGNGNFITFGSKSDFDIFEHDGESEGVWGLQMTWRIDEKTIAQMEWNQNWNPLDVSVTTDKNVIVYGFRQMSCSDSGDDAAFVQISFANKNFFEGCKQKSVTSFRPPEFIYFPGLTLTTGSSSSGSDPPFFGSGQPDGSLLFNFGYRSISASGLEPVLDTATHTCDSARGCLPQIAYASEMQLAVHDSRVIPIGWSAWFPKGEDNTLQDLCVMDCDTGNSTVTRHRYCQCFDETTGTIICEDPNRSGDCYDVDYLKKCQPCGGTETGTKEEPCVKSACTPTSDTTTSSTTDYEHWGCCAGYETTAIRVTSLNEDAEKLGINGVYELMYDEYTTSGSSRSHRYVRLKPPSSGAGAKAIVISQIFDDQTSSAANPTGAAVSSNWEILNCDVTPRGASNLDGPTITNCQALLNSADVATNCPIDSGGWTIADITKSPNNPITNKPAILTDGNAADIRVSCSTTRNKCPDSNPYSFHWGQYCCSSPFFHYGYESTDSQHKNAEVLSPDHECRTTDGYTVTATTDCEASRDTDGNRGCLGTVVACPSTDPVKYPCRSNLRSKSARTYSQFKATEMGHLWSYRSINMCSANCNQIEWNVGKTDKQHN